MAVTARGGIQRQQVKAWFAGLSFETQKTVIDELEGVFAEKKSAQIKDLEAQLAALRGTQETVKSVVKTGQRSSPTKGVKVPPKYIEKSTGKTWAGRGVQPGWVVAHIKKGGKLDDLLIGRGKGRT